MLSFIDKELDQIQDLLEAFKLHVLTNPDYLKFDLSELNKHLKTARNLTKPCNQTTPTPTAHQTTPAAPQTISLKLPKLQPTKWTGAPYNFYPWIFNCAGMFNQSSNNYEDSEKIQLLLQTMPLDKQSAFLHIDNWQEFKDKLICDFGSLETFQREALKQFSQIDQPL